MNWILRLIVTGSVFTLTICSTLDMICKAHKNNDVCVANALNPRELKLNFLAHTQSFRNTKTKIQFEYDFDNNLKTFPSGIFPAYKNLKTLDLTGCGITQIDENAFKDAHELLELNLWSNKIVNWKNSTFYGAENLKKLQIGLCNIQELPEGIFFKLINLRELDLSYNDIVNVPKEVFSKLTKLERLDLSFTKLQHLDEMTFASLGELTVLDINNNDLTVLSSNLFSQNVELRHLNLIGNELTDVEDSIRKLIKLETLIVYLNQLTVLNNYPESIKELNISDNNLKTLFIGKNVEKLNAEHNQIDYIRRATSGDTKIRTLNLSQNNLWSENDIKKLQQLRNFDLVSKTLQFQHFLKRNSIFMYLSMLSTKLMPNCHKLLMENVPSSVYDKCLKEFLCVVDEKYDKC